MFAHTHAPCHTRFDLWNGKSLSALCVWISLLKNRIAHQFFFLGTQRNKTIGMKMGTFHAQAVQTSYCEGNERKRKNAMSLQPTMRSEMEANHNGSQAFSIVDVSTKYTSSPVTSLFTLLCGILTQSTCTQRQQQQRRRRQRTKRFGCEFNKSFTCRRFLS